MILAVDVHYHEAGATVAGVLFEEWNSAEIHNTLTKSIANVEPYEPGSFYKRELPCILALLTDITTPIDTIVIDGYVHLGEERRPGLGQYLYEALDCKIPVIGVAKTRFKGTPESAEVTHGSSQSPLFVTAVGVSESDAYSQIRAMHGPFRIPTMLKLVDQLCRGITS